MILLLACSAPRAVEPAPDEPVEVVQVAKPPAPSFSVHVGPVPTDLRAKMQGVSMHPGCPVGFEGLAWIQASHYDLEGEIKVGQLVVAAEHAQVFVDVLRAAFVAEFPIERMVPVSTYGGDDKKSMRANNTSAFNCRAVTGGSGYSEHSHGHAIDINPLRNPYISRSGKVQPAEGQPYVDRTRDFPGKISGSGPVVAAFKEHGWGWGGTWKSSKDYQHFSVNGR